MIGSFQYQGFYYLESLFDSEPVHQLVAYGVMAKPRGSDDKECAWGYLVYQDVAAERQRIVPLDQSPILTTKKIVECVSQRGELFRFSYVNLDIWNEKVRRIVFVPSGMPELTTTRAVQEFLLR